MTQLCKMKLKKPKKVENFDFWSFLRFWQVEKSRRLKKSKSLSQSRSQVRWWDSSGVFLVRSGYLRHKSRCDQKTLRITFRKGAIQKVCSSIFWPFLIPLPPLVCLGSFWLAPPLTNVLLLTTIMSWSHYKQYCLIIYII